MRKMWTLTSLYCHGRDRNPPFLNPSCLHVALCLPLYVCECVSSPPSPVVEHTGASLPLIIGVNLRLSLAAGQWLTTLPVSQTLITTQVTHRPGNDWHEMETSLILWNPVELKWNISCGRDGGPIRGSLFGGWNCGGPRFHYISFYGVEILLASDKGSLSLHFHRFSISSFKTWQRATPRL